MFLKLFKVFKYDESISEDKNKQVCYFSWILTMLIGLFGLMFAVLAVIIPISLEDDYINILGGILLLPISIYFLSISIKNCKTFKTLTNDFLRCYAHHYSGIPGFSDNQVVWISVDKKNNKVIFTDNIDKKPTTVSLDIAKIIQTRTIAANEIVKESRLKNALVGGMLLGTTGAVLGALASEEKINTIYLYVLTYISGGEEKAVVLRQSDNALYKKVKEYIDNQMDDTSRNIEL